MNKPHVLVDARFTEHRRGGDRCRLELARGLLRRDGCRYTFLVYRNGRELLQVIDPSVQTVLAPHQPNRHPQSDFFEHFTLPSICRKLKVDLYHGTFQGMPWWRAAPVTAVTIHDLALFDFPNAYSRKFGFYMRTWLGHSIKKADHLITVSDTTGAAVSDRFPSAKTKLTTIHNGVGSEFSASVPSESDQRVHDQYNLPDRYVLFVGNLERKKNLPRLIRAFLQLKKSRLIEESLVVVGAKPDKLPADEFAELLEADNTTAAGVYFTGYIPDYALPAIYRGARAVAYPSMYEGFGMPVLEGMAAGVPVLTSNVSSLPEVAGNAAMLVDPTDVDAIAAGLHEVLQNDNWRVTAIAKGLSRAAEMSWDRNAEKTEQLYLSATQGRKLVGN